MKLFIYLLYGFLLITLFSLEEREISCFFVAINAFLAWPHSESLWKMKGWFRKSFPHEDNPSVGMGPREVGLSPSLRGFVLWLCKALSSQVWSHSWAFPGQGLGLETSPDPHQTGMSCNPVIFRSTTICFKFVMSGGDVTLKDDSLGGSCDSCSW